MWRKIVASIFNRFRNSHSGNFCLDLHCYRHDYDDGDDVVVVVVVVVVVLLLLELLFLFYFADTCFLRR